MFLFCFKEGRDVVSNALWKKDEKELEMGLRERVTVFKCTK